MGDFDRDDDEELYAFICVSNGVTTTRSFKADNIQELAYNMLQFANQAGYTYVDMVEFSSEDGLMWRAENV